MANERSKNASAQNSPPNLKSDNQGIAGRNCLASSQFSVEQSIAGNQGDAVAVIDQLPSAPDGGYGWVIVFAAFLHNFFLDGIANSFGVLLPIFRDHFQSSVALTSFIGSALIGCYHMIGPLVSGLVNAFGCRKVVLIGGCIAGIAFLLSVQSPNVYVFMLTYGLLGGLGFGFIYLPSIVCLSFYFEKKRAVATGLAVAGSGAGTFVMPIVLNQLIKKIGWEHSVYFLAALAFGCMLYGLLYRPLKKPGPVKTERTAETDNAPVNVHSNLALAGPAAGDEGLKRPPSRASDRPTYRRIISATRHRTVSQLSHATPSQDFALSSSRLGGSMALGHSRRDIFSRVSFRSFTHSISHLSQHRPETPSLSTAQDGINLKEVTRPLNRHDIFYQGSVTRLPEYVDEGCDVRNYRMSQISIPAEVAVQAIRQMSVQEGAKICQSCATLESAVEQTQPKGKCSCLPFSIRSALETMDFRLAKEPVMILLLLSNLCGMLAFYIPFMFVKPIAVANRAGEKNAELLLPLIGITNTVGRVFFGLLADSGWVSPMCINNAALFVCGFLCCLCPWLSGPVQLAAFSACFGFAIAAFSCLPSIILANLLGIKRLTNAFGLLVVSRGIAALIGTPIGGLIYDMTASYNVTFYFAGVVFVLAGIAPCAIPHVPQVQDDCSAILEIIPEPERFEHDKLSVVTEQSEENLTEAQRTIRSLKALKGNEALKD